MKSILKNLDYNFESQYVNNLISDVMRVEKLALRSGGKADEVVLMSLLINQSFRYLAKIKETVDDYELMDMIRFDIEEIILANLKYVIDKSILSQNFYVYYPSRKGKYNRMVITVAFQPISNKIIITSINDFITKQTYDRNRQAFESWPEDNSHILDVF